MAITAPSYIQGADLPDLSFAWTDQNNTLIDFSSGYTFALKLGNPGSTASLTKSTGITGASTSPNITVAWAIAGELNTLPAGIYTGQLIATRTSDSKNRYLPFEIKVLPAIT